MTDEEEVYEMFMNLRKFKLIIGGVLFVQIILIGGLYHAYYRYSIHIADLHPLDALLRGSDCFYNIVGVERPRHPLGGVRNIQLGIDCSPRLQCKLCSNHKETPHTLVSDIRLTVLNLKLNLLSML